MVRPTTALQVPRPWPRRTHLHSHQRRPPAAVAVHCERGVQAAHALIVDSNELEGALLHARNGMCRARGRRRAAT